MEKLRYLSQHTKTGVGSSARAFSDVMIILIIYSGSSRMHAKPARRLEIDQPASYGALHSYTLSAYRHFVFLRQNGRHGLIFFLDEVLT